MCTESGARNCRRASTDRCWFSSLARRSIRTRSCSSCSQTAAQAPSHGAGADGELLQVGRAVDDVQHQESHGLSVGLLGKEGAPLPRHPRPAGPLGTRKRMLGPEVDIEARLRVERGRVVVDGDELVDLGG